MEERPPGGPALKFLIVKFSAIGDCVMATYVASAIRAKHPNSEITWAIETRCTPVLDRGRLIDNVVDFPRDRWESNRWSPKTWREQMATFARLRSERYDFGLDLQGYAKTALCLKIAKSAQRVSAFANDGLSRSLNPLAPGDPNGKHRIERMMETLRTFGDFPSVERPIMPMPFSLAELGLPTSKPIASIATGAGHINKRYPPEKWAAVAEKLTDQGFQVVFLGAGNDPHVSVKGAIDWVGALSLGQSMSVVAGSKLHLAGDTGSGHMAAAYGVPVVSIFGPMNPDLFRPYSPNGVVLNRDGRPDAVGVEDVLQAVQYLGVDHGRALSY